jgi:hypothetical protein
VPQRCQLLVSPTAQALQMLCYRLQDIALH